MSLRINPIYDKLLPRMSEEDFAQLQASIKAEGQHYPIIVNEDLEVLDGHHRFRACVNLGIEPDFEVRKFDNKLLEKKFVIEANLRRRHLNNFQLVELAVPLLEIEKILANQFKSELNKEDNKFQLNTELSMESPDKFSSKAKATELVAKKAGVSTRTFERGKKIMEKASEDDKQKLREGKVSIAKVYQEIVSPKKDVDENPPVDASSSSALTLDSQTRIKLLNFLELLEKHELFCPECGGSMFECSNCHRTLRNLLKSKSGHK